MTLARAEGELETACRKGEDSGRFNSLVRRAINFDYMWCSLIHPISHDLDWRPVEYCRCLRTSSDEFWALSHVGQLISMRSVPFAQLSTFHPSPVAISEGDVEQKFHFPTGGWPRLPGHLSTCQSTLHKIESLRCRLDKYSGARSWNLEG